MKNKYILGYVLGLICMLLGLFGCSKDNKTEQFYENYNTIYSKINDLTECSDSISLSLSSLWQIVGPDYLEGVYNLILNAETATDLETINSSFTGKSSVSSGDVVKYKEARCWKYYDILAVALGYDSSYSSFKSGSSIPHSQSKEIIKYTLPIRDKVIETVAKQQQLEALVSEFKSIYKNEEKYRDDYINIMDYYVAAVSYADFVMKPSGSLISFTETIQEYQNDLKKLKIKVNT